MRLTKSFELSDYKHNKKILIYGAGNYGELAYRGLEMWGIHPDFFIDEYYDKEKYINVPVIRPPQIEEYKDEIILLASLNFFQEMLEEVVSNKCTNYYDILSLLQADYDNSIISEYLLEEKNTSNLKYKNVIDNVELNRLVIPHLDVVLTECCTLKCKDCANLMQYYSKPENLSLTEIIENLHNFLDTVDSVIELRLLGGEPFICKEIDKIIVEFANEVKVKRIVIITNSTVVPSKKIIESLKNPKVFVHMSNYGLISTKIHELRNIFDEQRIGYYIHEYKEWNDIGGIEKREYMLSEIDSIYKRCYMARCFTFYRGKFFLCPRSAHGEQLGVFKNKPQEFVDFRQQVFDWKEKRREMESILQNKKHITACEYCSGSYRESPKISAAIQVNKRSRQR